VLWIKLLPGIPFPLWKGKKGDLVLEGFGLIS